MTFLGINLQPINFLRIISAIPDTSLYLYDDTSGYYYDPATGLYYDPNSQYYYNSEIGSYLYWDQEKCTYVLASQADGGTGATSMAAYFIDQNTATTSATASNGSNSQAANSQATNSQVTNEDNNKEDKKSECKQDKVKVAKKIVKDMEKWAKMLNQKKENTFQAPVQQIVDEVAPVPSVSRQQPLQRMANGYADVGFSMMESREARLKPATESMAAKTLNKMLPYGSDSDNDGDQVASGPRSAGLDEKDLVDFAKLTCLLCKRAFQSLEILNKHIKMSNLHKENLQKLSLGNQSDNSNGSSSLSYRDRAKERRLKYGEVDPPPPNRSRERFEKEMRKQTVQMQKQASSNLANVPIDQSNVGNRLLQKMGWSEGQGLGKTNQGRTNIIEVSALTRKYKQSTQVSEKQMFEKC